MKYIKKLSSKLLLALGALILSVIVWQVIVSKRVIGDDEKIKQLQSIEQIQESLQNGELKTYRRIPCSPFTKIKTKVVSVLILKGNEYAVYENKYYGKNIELTQNGDELLLSCSVRIRSTTTRPTLFIVMPEDPQLVACTPPEDFYFASCNLYGFRGDNTLLSCEGQYVAIDTDMPYINISQKDNRLNLRTASLDSTLRIDNVRINVDAEKSWFRLFDQISDSINVNIQLQESAITEKLKINSKSKVGTLSLKGTLGKGTDKIKINSPGPCDSLIIQLTSPPGNAKLLLLSKGLSGRFEHIDCSENVAIAREE